MNKQIANFLDFVDKSRSYSSKTYTTYKSALQSFEDVVGSDAPLSKDTYIKFLRSTSDMNPSTQAICRSAIKGLYFFEADTDPSIDTSFFRQTDKRLALKTSKRPPMFDREGIEKIIQYADTMRNDLADLRDRAFIFLLADSGLRISEACNLRIGDVDWNEQKVSFTGKGDKHAILHISNRTTEALRSYLNVRNQAAKALPLFIRHDKRAGNEILPVDPGGMWYAIKRRAVEAGVDKSTIRVHDFRHYFVTTVYQVKGIKLAQKLARHERIDTTDRYTHLVEDEGKAYDEIFNH